MISVLVKLYLNFFYVGAFAIGGGYAMIPLFQQIVTSHGWLTTAEFTDMIAVSQMTPGPIAINLATFIGYRTAGIAGAVTATAGVCSPAFILVISLVRFVSRFEENHLVKGVLENLRPVVVGLIAAAAAIIGVNASLFDVSAFNESGQFFHSWNGLSMILAAAVMYGIHKFDIHPILYILGAGVVGAVLM